MKCVSKKKCSGTMLKKRTNLKLKRKGKRLTISDVQVFECSVCGEQVFPYKSAELIEAYKNYSGKVLLRIEPLFHKKLIEKAKQENRSLNQEVSHLLKKAL